MKIEACRVFAWKAAHYLDLHDPEGHVAGAVSKVHCSETMFQAVFEAMQVMGVNSHDTDHPVERYLREAHIFPLRGQRIPASISSTRPPIVCGVTTPAPVFSDSPGILYFADSTHCTTGMKP
jgi:hypothetical protein